MRNKTAELANVVGYVDPSILLLSETKLNDRVSSSKFLPENYTGFRRDRAPAGGVLVAIKDTLVAREVELIDVSIEIIWVKILLKNLHPLYVGSFYHQPSDALQTNSMSWKSPWTILQVWTRITQMCLYF